MRPYLANTVKRKSIKLTLKRITETIVDYRPVETEEELEILGQLKPLRLENIKKDEIDYHLRYMFYTGLDEVKVNDIIVHNGSSFRCYAPANYGEYGFYKAYLEEIKE